MINTGQTLTVERERYEEHEFHPLNMHVAEGDDEGHGINYQFGTTIGMGGVGMILTVRKDGKSVSEFFDMMPAMQKWIAAVYNDEFKEEK